MKYNIFQIILRLKPVKTNSDDNANSVPESNGVTSTEPVTTVDIKTENNNTEAKENSESDKENVSTDTAKDSNENGVNSESIEERRKKFKDLPKEEQDKLLEEEEAQRKKLEEERLLAEEQEYEKMRRRIAEAKRKKLEEQKFKEEMFWRIFHLVRHSGDRTVEDYLHRAVMACFMLKALRKTKYFEEFKPSGVGKCFGWINTEIEKIQVYWNTLVEPITSTCIHLDFPFMETLDLNLLAVAFRENMQLSLVNETESKKIQHNLVVLSSIIDLCHCTAEFYFME